MDAIELISTNDLTHEEWLKWRRAGIGGSDVSVLLGINKYKSPVELFLDKTEQLENKDINSEAAYWGNTLEEIVAQEFSKRTELKVRKKNAILQHPEYPWMLANVDRLIVGQKVGLECKTASEYLKDSWKDDEIPDSYLLQCQHYMAVTGYESWWIAVLIGGNKFVFKQINRDQELIDILIEKESFFWNENVLRNIPPAFDGSSASSGLLKKMYPNSNDSEIELDNESNNLVRMYREGEELEKQGKYIKDEATNKLKGILGEFERGLTNSNLITWKSSIRNTVDTKLLKTNYPEVYEDCMKQSTTRTFKIKELA